MQACITQAAKHSSLKPAMQHHPMHCHTAMPQRRTKGHHGAERPELSVCREEEDTEALPTLGRTESKGRHRAPAAAAAAQAQAAPAGRGITQCDKQHWLATDKRAVQVLPRRQ